MKHLTIVIEIDCRRVEVQRYANVRPQCAEMIAPQVSTYVDHVAPGTPLPQRCQSLELLEVEVHSLSHDPWLPDVNLVAECLVAMGGPNCQYIIRPTAPLPADRLVVTRNAARTITTAVNSVLRRGEKVRLPGFKRLAKELGRDEKELIERLAKQSITASTAQIVSL